MEKIVALCKRRGFIFPSSEIYGGLGLDVRLRALRRAAEDQRQERVVAGDAPGARRHRRAGLRDPPAPARVGGRGHLAGFTDPLVDCRACKQRFRADHLDPERDVPGASRRACPGPRTADCDLTEARDFNLMFETTVGPVRGVRLGRLPAPGDRAGHLHQLQERPAVQPQEAAVRHRPGRQVVPQRDHAGQLHLPHARVRADGDGVLRAAGRGAATGTSTGSTSAARLVRGPRASAPTTCACASTTPTSSATTPSGTSRRRVPLPDRLVRARGHRQPRRLRPHPATPSTRGEKLEYFDQATGERYVPHVIEPAAGADRATLAFLVDAYDEEEVERRDAHRAASCTRALAPVKVAVLPLVRKDGQPELAREVFGVAARRSCRPSTTRAARSASATAARTRSARRGA